jgi:hypothetical protein
MDVKLILVNKTNLIQNLRACLKIICNRKTGT